MRLQLPELMAEHGITNAHDLAKRSGIPMATAYRLVGNEGRLDKRLSAVLEALCDVFKVEPCQLLKRDTPDTRRRPKARKPATQKRPPRRSGRTDE